MGSRNIVVMGGLDVQLHVALSIYLAFEDENDKLIAKRIRDNI